MHLDLDSSCDYYEKCGGCNELMMISLNIVMALPDPTLLELNAIDKIVLF
jgi:hypothetical protein